VAVLHKDQGLPRETDQHMHTPQVQILHILNVLTLALLLSRRPYTVISPYRQVSKFSLQNAVKAI
jgi:hypothetical protein